MTKSFRWVFVFAMVLGGCGQRTQPETQVVEPWVHPFEAPPQLKEAGGAQPVALALTAPGRTQCDEQGEVRRDGDIVSVKLNVVLADFTINNPANPGGADDRVMLRSYGGCKSGPEIDAKPGDTLRIDLVNKLDAKPDPTCMKDVPGCFNTINLHTHGLHVSPTGNSDNVLLNIAPQTEFPYEINIPSDHPSGTFWYHAHRHGSTALQVASGSSGILLVKGNREYDEAEYKRGKRFDVDTILKDAQGNPMPEKSFLFQQIAYACFVPDPKNPWQNIYTDSKKDGGLYNSKSDGSDPDGPANAAWICPKNDPQKPSTPGAVENFNLQLNSATIWDTNGRFTSVNGVVQPTLGVGNAAGSKIEAGEIQRWRFVHAGIHDTINLQIVHAKLQASHNYLATSQLTGNRQQQLAEVKEECPATAESLIPQFEIANDGLTRTKIHVLSGKSEPGSMGSNYMQPGYRSDVLVVFPSDGVYCLLNQAAPESERANHGGRGQGPGGQGPDETQLLAYIRVQGGKPVGGDLREYVEQALYDRNSKLPDSARNGLKQGDLTPWAPFSSLDPPVGGKHDKECPEHQCKANFILGPTGPNGAFQFKINNNPGKPTDGMPYNPDVVNVTRQVNTTDDWTLTAGPVPKISSEPHIFHIHVNPFEVVDVTKPGADGKQVSIFDANGNCKPDLEPPDSNGLVNQYCGLYHVFRDTLFVENGYEVHMRTRYDRYIGEFVIHCHILDHEDGGMMWNIQIVPDASAEGGGLGMPGMKHSK